MASLHRILNEHEKRILQQISTVEAEQKNLMKNDKTPLTIELQHLNMKNASLELLSNEDYIRLLQMKQEFHDYVEETNKTLEEMKRATRTYYKLQGLDQLEIFIRKLGECGQCVKYNNLQLEKQIADNGTKQELDLSGKCNRTADIMIVADALQNNTVRKIFSLRFGFSRRTN